MVRDTNKKWENEISFVVVLSCFSCHNHQFRFHPGHESLYVLPLILASLFIIVNPSLRLFVLGWLAMQLKLLMCCRSVLQFWKCWKIIGAGGRNSAKMFDYKKHTPYIKYYKHLQTASLFNLTRTVNCMCPVNTSGFYTVFHKGLVI